MVLHYGTSLAHACLMLVSNHAQTDEIMNGEKEFS